MINRLQSKLIKASYSISYFFVWIIHFLIFSPFLRFKFNGLENLPNKGKYILAANHQNFFDGFFLAYPFGPFKRPCFIIAKRALKTKLFLLLAKSIGAVIIGSEIEEYQRALRKLNRTLSEGRLVVIFPEGDISRNNTPKRFKPGVAKISIDSKAKVIPVHLNGSYNLRYLTYWLKRPQISVKIGTPIELYSYVSKFGNNLDQIASVLREKIIELDSPSSKTLSNIYDIKSKVISSDIQNIRLETVTQ